MFVAPPVRHHAPRPATFAMVTTPLLLCFLLVPPLSAQDSASRPHETVLGTPWRGARGITESVEAIMARQRVRDRLVGPPYVMLKPELKLPERTAVDPEAPAVSRWPPGTESATPRFRQSEPRLPQPVGTSFLGIAAGVDSLAIPPDSMGGVGPTQVVVASNGRLRTFSKSGVLGPLDVEDAAFWASVSENVQVSDPRVRYDRLSGRWFLTIITVPNDGVNAFGPNLTLIAVSSDPTITSSSSFTFFAFQQDLPSPAGDTNGFADYNTLGVDRFALYIGANVFSQDLSTFLGSSGFVVNKADLIAGTLTVTALRQLANATGVGCTTPQGVTNDDPSPTEGYFVGVDGVTAGRLVLRRVMDPGGTPSISGSLNLAVPTTSAPIDVPARLSPFPLDGLDDRLFAAEIRRNRLTGTSTLWTAHNIEVNAAGVAAAGGGRNGSRWYQIDSLSTTPALVQAGTLFDSAGTNPRSFWIPSANMSGQGHMALGMSVAGPADYAGVAVAGRFSGDPLGTTAAPTVAQPGLTFYDDFVSATDQRWGDYSQMVVDPNDDMTFWTFQEYTTDNFIFCWSVRAIQLRAPPPATPSGAAPASVAAGQASVAVTITGTSSSGSGFFDPGPDPGGPGFANRISASLSGGVTVNSVTFTSPTQLTLVLNTTAATAGLQTVTITNPDGQSAAGAVLTVGSGVSGALVSGTKTVTGTFVPSGAITYTVVLTNTGSGTQANNPGNEFTDVLPATLTLVSASATGGTATATVATRTVTWNGSIGAGAAVTVTIQATINASVAAGTSISNQGQISYDSDGNGTNEANGLTDDPTVVGTTNPTVFFTAGAALLSGTKTVAGTLLTSGAITYTLVLTNSGTGAQANNPGDELTDVLPASLTLASAIASSGTATATVGTNTVTWNGSLAVSASVTITIQAAIKSTVTGGTLVSNQGAISYDSDGNGTNDAPAQTDDPAVVGAANPTVFTVRGAFFTVTPCRVVDTRTTPNGPLAGPALVAGASRVFGLASHCGVPSTAKAVSLNVTVTQPTGAGDLRLYPAGSSAPLVSTINWVAGQTRANNAVAALSATGLAVLCDQASGTVHLILDVNGYFQ